MDNPTVSQVVGETLSDVFQIYEVKPVPPGQFGTIGQYTIQHGLYEKQADELYCIFMLLRRPPMDSKATQLPKLHMWRCAAYPDNLADLISRQAFESQVRRDEPHWAVRGSPDSMDGWVWSAGDGWFWTEKRGYFEPVPRRGRGTPWASSRSGAADQAAGGVAV